MHSNGPMYLGHGLRQPNFVPKFGASVIGIGPYEEKGKSHQPPGPAAHSGAFALLSRGRAGIAAEIIPKGASNLGQSLSHGLWPCQFPLHKGAFGDGDADCRVASLLAMTVRILCHSEEAQRADVGIRPFYDGRGFEPPSRRPLRMVYRSPSSGPMWSSAPTGGCRELPRLPGQRLAKRKARKESLVKFGLCPMTSECSTAQKVRKSGESPARAPVGAAVTE